MMSDLEITSGSSGTGIPTDVLSEITDYHVAQAPPRDIFARHPSKPHLSGLEEYQRLYRESITNPNQFWGRLARELLTWFRDFQTVHSGSLINGDNSWFLEGQLNASYNCVDRHAIENPQKPAIIFEADDPENGRILTFGELLRQICKTAYMLKHFGVKKGDTVTIYLPMIPEALIAIFACARIGAIHSVVFAGFSSRSLCERILDANSTVIITTDEGKRGGKYISTKKIVDDALQECHQVKYCLVYRHTGRPVPWKIGRDIWWHDEVDKWPSYISPETMNSEDPLFLLYTSGSTSKPKGVLHSTAGYLVGAAATGKYVFDIHDTDVFFCGGDVGWITGHTYAVYAPLLLGVATVVFEGTPTYPDHSRYWKVIVKYNVTQFYVAPTALRLLKRAGDHHLPQAKFKNLRVLGSVGEPIAAEIWKWYYEIVGRKEAHIVDTYWQTETGSHAITSLAGIIPMKPGSASFPFFGIEPAIIDSVSGKEIDESNLEGVLVFKQPWPSMARTIWGSHKRYINTYLDVFKGYYFTGDAASRDDHGYYWIHGRVDDVINVSGHRLSTAEIEAALISHHAVAEAAVVGVSDEITGQAINAFVSIKEDLDTANLPNELILHVRKSIGPFASPKAIHIIKDLPKTRSGKIMRRILRKILAGEEDSIGDISTLSDPTVVEKIIQKVKGQVKASDTN